MKISPISVLILLFCPIYSVGFSIINPPKVYRNPKRFPSQTKYTMRKRQSGNLKMLDEKLQKFNKWLASNDMPMLVDFYATWCGPCQLMGPVLEEVADKMRGKVKVAKIDTEVNPTVASYYKIKGLPTLVIFNKRGQEIARLEGFYHSYQIIPQVEYYIGGQEEE
uniref:Thioredoxin n=1 Tax=Chattonella marina var. antiqua TaxID=859642 RepID=A0A2Z5VKK5_CHAMQ|nr:thioredoxin [Chattonella marina var. antiqua]